MIDVGGCQRWPGGHIPGSVNLPPSGVGAGSRRLPPGSRLTFHRGPIGRGTPGAGLLARMGHEHVAVAGDGGGTAPSFGPTGCSP